MNSIRLNHYARAWSHVLIACLAIGAGIAAQPQVNLEKLDWAAFLGRHDLLWQRLPDRFENAAFTGNGQLGAMVMATEQGQVLKWQMGRSDVAFSTFRIPIGDLLLRPAGKILSAEMRLDLWQAELRGTLRTDKGSIEFRTFTHSQQMVNVWETVTTGAEKVSWSWQPGLASNPRKLYRKETLSPEDQNVPAQSRRDGETEFSLQALKPAGGHATAWRRVQLSPNSERVFASVGFANDLEQAAKQSQTAVNAAVAQPWTSLLEAHRSDWRGIWQKSFVSFPDTRLEGFYQIQTYKMASATRADRPALDLMGPWFRATAWAKIWWNLNIQLAYWPQLTGNRLELGESLCRLIDHNAAALASNAGAYKDDSAAVGRATGYDCVGPVGDELCNLPWTMHNYWLQYRYCMDDQMLRERIFPMLKRSTNMYLHLLERRADGRLHLTRGMSPEYPKQPTPNPNCNIDLALLRWGCQTLIESCERLKITDPQLQQWRDTLRDLTPYPQDEHGLRISEKVPFAESHRHYSHLVMIYPLYLMTPEQPENRDLTLKSLKHWMGMPAALQGYSYTGASSISSLLGEGDAAASYLNRLLDTKIPANTLYVEGGGPCIETPLSAAASVNDMMLSSWGGRIRVFPAIPSAWGDVAFHQLRAQGAFLVSASRKQGKTQWVWIKSLAGEPCVLRPGLEGRVRATVPLKPAADGAYELPLAKGEAALLYVGERPPLPVIDSVKADPQRCNFYGLKR